MAPPKLVADQVAFGGIWGLSDESWAGQIYREIPNKSGQIALILYPPPQPIFAFRRWVFFWRRRQNAYKLQRTRSPSSELKELGVVISARKKSSCFFFFDLFGTTNQLVIPDSRLSVLQNSEIPYCPLIFINFNGVYLRSRRISFKV